MYKVCVLALVCTSAFAADVLILPDKNVHYSPRMRGSQLIHEDSDFFVQKEGVRQMIKRPWVSPEFRGRNTDMIRKASEAAVCFKLGELKDGEPYLKYGGSRGKGGGPLTGIFLYGITKVVAWSTVGATTAAVLTTVSPVIASTTAGSAAITAASSLASMGASSVVVGPVTSTIVGSLAGTVAGTTLASTGAAATIAGGAQTAIAVAAMSGEALTLVAGTVAAVTTGVEAVSTGAFYLGCAIPWLP